MKKFGRSRASAPADAPDTYELSVYGPIGEDWFGEGITAESIKNELDTAPEHSKIRVRINSPGGDAFEGIAIHNLLRSRGKPVETCVDGLAASSASIIAMAGDEITMGANAMMMIHNAWSMCAGDANDMRKTADTLEKISESVAQTYVGRTGKSATEIQELMDAETWMSAKDCVKGGFATRIAKSGNAKAMAAARNFPMLAKYAKLPDSLQNAAKADDDAPMCACDCENCTARNCKNCTDEDCADKNCMDCPMQNEDGEETVDDRAKSCVDAWLNYRRITGAGLAMDFAADGQATLAIRVFNEAARKEANKITGVVAPYESLSADLGNFREIYQRGCFSDSLGDDGDPRVVFNHNPDYVLGRKSAGTARFWEDASGLRYEADAPDTQWARDLQVSLERGDIRESSAAFYILQHRWEQRGSTRVRVVEKARLVEGGPHSFAAYSGSTAEAEPQANSQANSHELELIGARLQLLRLQ